MFGMGLHGAFGVRSVILFRYPLHFGPLDNMEISDFRYRLEQQAEIYTR